MKRLRAIALVSSMVFVLLLTACGGGTKSATNNPNGPGGGAGGSGSSSSPEFLYLGTLITNDVFGFQIDPSSGALTSIGSASALEAGTGMARICNGPICGGTPKQLVADPLGRFVYYMGVNGLTVFQVGTDGSLTRAAGVPGSAFGTVGLEPQGRFVYLISGTPPPASPTIQAYQVGTSGSLTPVGAAETLPRNASAVAATGSFVYVSAFTNPGSAVAEFSINADGSLTPLTGSPMTIPGIGSLGSAVVDPSGRFLYIPQIYFPGNVGQYQLLAYAIGSNGQLTPVPGSPFPTGNSATGSLVTSPDGAFLYAWGSNGPPAIIQAYTIHSDGSLSLSASSTIAGATNLVLDRTSRFAYLETNGALVNGFSVNSNTGALSPLSSAPLTAVPAPDVISGAAVVQK